MVSGFLLRNLWVVSGWDLIPFLQPNMLPKKYCKWIRSFFYQLADLFTLFAGSLHKFTDTLHKYKRLNYIGNYFHIEEKILILYGKPCQKYLFGMGNMVRRILFRDLFSYKYTYMKYRKYEIQNAICLVDLEFNRVRTNEFVLESHRHLIKRSHSV